MGPQGIDKIQATFGGNIDVSLARGRATGQRFIGLTLEHGKSVSDVMRPLAEAGLAYNPRLHDGSEVPTPDTNPEDPLLIWRSGTGSDQGIDVFCEDLHVDSSL